MKQIIGLSLSALALAAFVFALQSQEAGKSEGIGKALLSSEQPAEASPAVLEKKAEPPKKGEGLIVAAAQKTTALKKAAPPSKSERVRDLMQKKNWEEARPEVVRILNEGGRDYRPGKESKRDSKHSEKRERRDDDDDD